MKILRNGWQIIPVTPERPCAVCHKEGWCAHVVGGGSLCQRVESARRVGEAGWYHADPSGAEPVITEAPKPKPPLYGPMLKAQRRYVAAINRTAHLWRDLIGDLGVDEPVLRSMGVGWAAEAGAYSFPMRDGGGRIVGIRYRALNGRKWALPGSKSGLFLSENAPLGVVMMPEGPSDSAVLRELGFSVWGRPDARSGSAYAIYRLTKLRAEGILPSEVVIVGDDDRTGKSGANHFATEIARSASVPVRVVIPPKGLDVRQWVDGFGITAPMFEAYARSRELIRG
jgi:hypothetical protein